MTARLSTIVTSTLLIAAVAAGSAAAGPDPRLETHEPAPAEPLMYDGGLQPGIAESGRIGFGTPSPNDGYDWFCFEAVDGQTITVDAVRTAGNIIPNLGILQGMGNNGDRRSTLVELAVTSNPDMTSVQLAHVPNFSGPVTIWVSTWEGETDGSYDVTMRGGIASAQCGVAMAVVFDRIEARRIPDGVQLRWSTLLEEGVIGFRILRSSDHGMAAPTSPVDWVDASGLLSGGTYSAIDVLQGLADRDDASYYQIQEITNHGFGMLSPVVRVDGDVRDGFGTRQRRGAIRASSP